MNAPEYGSDRDVPGYQSLWEAYDEDEQPEEAAEDEQSAETGEPNRDWRAHLNDEHVPF